MANKFEIDRNNEPMALGLKAVAYTPADTDLPPEVKAVVFDADGTISFKNTSGGSAVTGYPVIKGQPLAFVPLRVTAMTGPTACFLIS